MHRASKHFRVGPIPLYALGAIFLVPLSIGVLLVNANANANDRANQLSRDTASMYAQGMDFSRIDNRNIALNAAEGLGVNLRTGAGVVILSKIRMVQASDCEVMATCVNQGYPVVTQRYVIGNADLRTSSLATPNIIDLSTGNVQNWLSDPSARAKDFHQKLKAGEFSYVAECYLKSPDSHGGIYSRTIF